MMQYFHSFRYDASSIFMHYSSFTETPHGEISVHDENATVEEM